MQTQPAFIVAALALASTACSDSGGSTQAPSTPEDIASHQQFVASVESTISDYQDDMLGDEMTSVAACRAVHDDYDTTMRPRVQQMGQMGGGMDAFMMEHGGGDMADMSCTAAGMMTELDRHHAVACSLEDLPADQSEAVRHAGAMNEYAVHMNARSDQMMSALNGGVSWGPMMSGCEDWDSANMMHGRQ